MERESFEDEEVARILNKYYIAIKVDREERPDVDHIYMSVCQALTGHGGWPLTIVMTPDKKPFYAGTYFPKRARMGYPGIIDVLEYLHEAWTNERDKLLESSESIMKHLEAEIKTEGKAELTEDTISKAFKGFFGSFDQSYGGFGSAPKFPTPHNLTFLLRYWKSTENIHALHMVEKTLESMYRGGIYDHIGFGFSRYSTDRKWLVPHFEKMLYDNALLAIVYLEAYQATGKAQYSVIAQQIFEYVLRDMTSPEGGFYSAEDADSEGEEGKFYVWTPEEIKNILGSEQGGSFCRYFDITENGNFEGKNIPNIIANDAAYYNLEARNKLLPEEIDKLRKKVFDAREKRVHPHKDDKILTAWNGLMIAALALGARVLDRKEYSEAAGKAVRFINSKLRRHDGRLLARYRDGEAAFPAYLDDYAFMIWGLIELYEADFELEYLKQAIELSADMNRLFYDSKNGGFFLNGADAEQLIVRPKDVYDGAIPSGNSVATLNYLRMARLTGNIELEENAIKQVKTFGGTISSYPMGYAYFMMAAQFISAKASEIIIVGDKKDEDTKAMLDLFNKSFMPFTVIAFKDTFEDNTEFESIMPFTENQYPIEEKATAYICENFACKAPVTDLVKFKEMLQH